MKTDQFFNKWDTFLYNFHLYYRNLDDSGKKRFVKRVESIYQNVTIIGKEGLKVNEDLRILVISNLVQLTFGLKNYWLYGYEYINLYPEAFFLESGEEAVAGTTYQNKVISISWHDFAIDHLKARDGKNISLVQYAQALVRTVINGRKFDLHFGSYIDNWFEIISKESLLKSDLIEIENLKSNQEEVGIIFSKSVELFFETPEIFKKSLPTSYAHMCLLLNQDPLNITENYTYSPKRFAAISISKALPKKVPLNFKYKNWHWVYNFSLFGVTLCPMFLFLITGNLLIKPLELIAIILISGVLISIVSFSFFKRIGLFKSWGMLLINGIFGFGPVLVTTLLFFNQTYAYQFSSRSSRHAIVSYDAKEHNDNQNITQTITFTLSDNYMSDFPRFRTFDSFDKIPVNKHTLFNGIEYEIRNGLIGFPIVTKIELY